MKRMLSLISAVIALGGMAFAQSQPKISPQSIVVNPVPTELQVKVSLDKAGENPGYQIGEAIKISVTVNQDAYVYLFSVHSDGNIDMILPNKLSGGLEFLKAGEVRSFPTNAYRLNVAGPAGQDKVLAVASLRQLNYTDLVQYVSGANFASAKVTGQDNFARALSIIVTPVPATDWTTNIAYFQVLQTPVVVTPPANTGNVQINAITGANVYVDGQLAGQAPINLNIVAGRHVIRVSAPNYRDYSAVVNVVAGRSGTIEANLVAVATNGTLQVNGPRGANVYVDGQLVGQAPLNLNNITPGRHVVRVLLDGYREFSQVAQVAVGQNTVVNAQLVAIPREGQVKIQSNFAGAEVFINGNRVARTGPDGSVNVTNLPAGTYELVMLAPGYKVFVTTFTVAGGQVTNVLAQLNRI